MKKSAPKKSSIYSFFILAGILGLAFLGYFLISEASEMTVNTSDGYVSSGLIIDLDAEGFDDAVSEGIVLVDFWATWCPPCRIQNPILEELAVAVSDVATITKLDVDDHGSVASRFHVRSIPTLILFKDGQIVERYTGVQQKETLKAAIHKHL